MFGAPCFFRLVSSNTKQPRDFVAIGVDLLPTTRLFLIRHGETVANRENRYIGVRDDPLSSHRPTPALQLAVPLPAMPFVAPSSGPLHPAYDPPLPIATHTILHIHT